MREGPASSLRADPSNPGGKPRSRLRISPIHSVVVTNELFHNGNVEAWKRIIGSYGRRYPDLQVFVYYDGERIVDLNALFKWGKVKHGSAIEFAVVGENLAGVDVLHRCLAEAASYRYAKFLLGSVNSDLVFRGD